MFAVLRLQNLLENYMPRLGYHLPARMNGPNAVIWQGISARLLQYWRPSHYRQVCEPQNNALTPFWGTGKCTKIKKSLGLN